MCKILRSDTKNGLYVYLAENQTISDLPDELVRLIGRYTQVMELDLDKTDKLALVDIETVKSSLIDKGYFVQIPQQIATDLVSFKT